MFTPQSSIASAKVIASSILPSGVRVDTLQLHYWRGIHSELLTHRDFSRNASSSRAIPIQTMLLRDEAYIPRFKKNKPGMSPGAYLADEEQIAAEAVWREALEACKKAAATLSAKDGLNIHKQWPNRMLEWFGFIDVLVTSTRWSNWDALRMHPDAQDEIRFLAEDMHAARSNVRPRHLKPGEWHTPYVTEEDEYQLAKMVRDQRLPDDAREVLSILASCRDLEMVPAQVLLTLAVSAARACRVSYAKLDGSPTTVADDMKRYLLLAKSAPLHASPLEHQCRDLTMFDPARLQGNLVGTVQFRKCLPNEVM